jgi:hypothetical protein
MVTSVAGESAIGIAGVSGPTPGVLIARDAAAGNNVAASIAIDAVLIRMGLSLAAAISVPRH